MRRSELEHAIRAASSIVNQDGVIVIGSQAILGSFTEDELPPRATLSREVDIRPLEDDEAESLATVIDGAIGEDSPFDDTFGFYVQGVGAQTAVLPRGWADRLVVVNTASTNGKVGYCLEPHDLCVAKLIASREKDHEFVAALIDAGIVDATTMEERLKQIEGHEEHVDRARQWLQSVGGRA